MRVTICDVGPRDGLQNEPEILSPETRAELVNRLAAAGLPRVEAASFVNPARVPQMADAEEVVAGIERRVGTEYAGLALNERGFERLRQTALDKVHFAFGVTDGFNRRNANASVEEGAATAERIVGRAHEDGLRATVTLSVAFGCPFDGPVAPARVADLAERVVQGGADEIVLADTIGVAVPSQVRRLVERVSVLGRPVGIHLHNTRNTGFAAAYAALESGVTLFDASVGGLGGCPYAPRATGNVATEDLVYLLEGEGVDTRIDLDALIGVAEWLEALLGRRLEGQVYRAGPSPTRTTPVATSSAISSSE
ncbi:MAG: hydroxymethylglutaryl-CoA lyase [Actinomycetota bacterium]|nr:hydroxymethylglutaryl-CoA lyase [Actinomycetota bacterium]